jgi:hypothetical protein
VSVSHSETHVTAPTKAALLASPSASKRVRAAAALLVAYGIIVLVNAVVLQSMANWVEWPQFFRGLIRVVGVSLLAWGLLRGERWAWWGTVGLGGFWLIAGSLLLVGAWFPVSDPTVPIPAFSRTILTVAVFVVAIAIALILTPPVRAAFRRPLQN